MIQKLKNNLNKAIEPIKIFKQVIYDEPSLQYL